MKPLSIFRVLAFAVAAPALLSACATAPEPEPATVSRAQAVLDAQYAAKAKSPPMQAAEADRIYENYIENIGKSVVSKDEEESQ